MPRRPLNTAEAATLCGMTTGVFRAHMARLRAAGTDLRLPRDQWIDGRTPLYDAAAVTAWAKGRQA